MKNIFNNKTNAPYLVSGALAIGALLASGIFAVAPYAGFLAPVAALSLGLPFVIGGAVFSAAAIALSAVVISKNNTISEKNAQLGGKDTQISSLEKQLVKRDRAIEAKNKAIANLNEDDILKRQERREKRQEEVLNYADLRNLFKGEKQQEEVLDPVALSNLFDESTSPENQPTKEENGQGCGAWGKAKVAGIVTTGVGALGAALYYAVPLISTIFEGVVASSMGNGTNVATALNGLNVSSYVPVGAYFNQSV